MWRVRAGSHTMAQTMDSIDGPMSQLAQNECPLSGSMRARYIWAAHSGQSGRPLVGVFSSVYSKKRHLRFPVCRRGSRTLSHRRLTEFCR